MATPKKPKKPRKPRVSDIDPSELRPRAKLTYGRPSRDEAAQRPGGKSPLLVIRVAPADLATIDAIAKAEGVANRSEMVRRLLLLGIANHKRRGR
jgi:hypothetical protein